VFFAYISTVDQVVARLLAEEAPPAEKRILRELQIEDLQRDAKRRDQEAADAAVRRLAHAYVTLSFYTPRMLLADGRAERALLSLALAERITPGTARVALFRARAFVQLDRESDALSALEEAVRRGISPAVIRSDPSFENLADSPRYQAITGGVR
jgi:hypothetical protein